MKVFVFQGTSPPSSYPKIENFLKLTLDMLTTSKIMQTSILAISKYVHKFPTTKSCLIHLTQFSKTTTPPPPSPHHLQHPTSTTQPPKYPTHIESM